MGKATLALLPGLYLGGILLSVGTEFFGFQAAGGSVFAWDEALSFACYWPFRVF